MCLILPILQLIHEVNQGLLAFPKIGSFLIMFREHHKKQNYTKEMLKLELCTAWGVAREKQYVLIMTHKRSHLQGPPLEEAGAGWWKQQSLWACSLVHTGWFTQVGSHRSLANSAQVT